ncbi:MAG: AtpZ/AtpI family protein [Oscillospiraceae bacterium]
MDFNNFSKILRGIAIVSQVGVSLITPILLSILLVNFLQDRYSISGGITILLILVGFAVGVSSFISIIKKYLNITQKQEKKSNEDIDRRN